MKISRSILPEHSILKPGEKDFDYVDSYQGDFVDKTGTTRAAEIGKMFFASSPKWVDRLFAFRNRLVGFIGLKTNGKLSERRKRLDNFKCEVGERIGLFKVFSRTDDEVVLGEDDKHLDFRVSLFIEKHMDEPRKTVLTISTAVKYNNWFGRLYFLPVRPFHKLIVPAKLRAIIDEIEKQN